MSELENGALLMIEDSLTKMDITPIIYSHLFELLTGVARPQSNLSLFFFFSDYRLVFALYRIHLVNIVGSSTIEDSKLFGRERIISTQGRPFFFFPFLSFPFLSFPFLSFPFLIFILRTMFRNSWQTCSRIQFQKEAWIHKKSLGWSKGHHKDEYRLHTVAQELET